MDRAEDTIRTGAIDLSTARPRGLRKREEPAAPDPDAPKAPNQTPSGLVTQLVDDVLAAARSDKPDPNQAARLSENVRMLAKLAEAGLAVGRAASGGGSSGGGGPWTVIVAGAVAAIVALAVPNYTGGNQALAGQIVLRMDTSDARITAIEEEINGLELALGKTIEWLGNEQHKACEHDKEQAKALNWLARYMPKSKHEDVEDAQPYDPIVINCDPNPLLPTEMEELRLRARKASASLP